MKNLELYDKFKVVPENAKKKITGGRLSGMTDINPMWRIKKLTEEFGVCGFGWKYLITDKRFEKGANDEIAVFVDIELFVKIDDKWSDAIQGTGGSSFVTKEKNGLYTSDECVKMALTDAISVACKSLGIAADVYFEKDATKYNMEHQSSNDMNDLIVALQEVKEAKNVTNLEQVWNNWKAYQQNTQFKNAVKTRKNELSTK